MIKLRKEHSILLVTITTVTAVCLSHWKQIHLKENVKEPVPLDLVWDGKEYF